MFVTTLEKTMTKQEKMRALAGNRNNGQYSALYAYSSTGTILPGLEKEVLDCLDQATTLKDSRQLQALYAFIAAPVTKEVLVNLPTEFWHKNALNANGSPVRCRPNGTLKTWKRDPERFQLPVKHGFRTCFHLTNQNAGEWSVAP
jgi:hypothetical protein